MSTNSQTFQELLQKVSECPTIEEGIKEAEKNYNIKAYNILEVTPLEASKFYESIYTKYTHQEVGSTRGRITAKVQDGSKMSEDFLSGLLSATHISKKSKSNHLYLRSLSEGEKDWQYFAKIFDRKDPRIFEYQCHCLYLEKKGRNWQENEENLLKLIIEQGASKTGMNKIKWNEVSKSLFQMSNKKYLRTPKQCRERWNNHLDPSKIKGMWRREECLLMFEYVQQHGKKWANIVKILGNVRNEHSIKNKFNSLIKKQTKSRKDVPEQQMYAEIISRIKSAIANEKYSMKANSDGFDLEDGEEPINIMEEKKVSNFAEKMMMKLMNFGKTTETSISEKTLPSNNAGDMASRENLNHNGDELEMIPSVGQEEKKEENENSLSEEKRLSHENSLSSGDQCSESSSMEEIAKDGFNPEFLKGENDLRLSCSFEEGFQNEKNDSCNCDMIEERRQG